MKALSLWQPWASAIAVGSKRIETRHWSTNYRGPLLIHAAKRCVQQEMTEFSLDPVWRGALRPCGLGPGALPLCKLLPLGAIVAVSKLKYCLPVEEFTAGELAELRFAPGLTSCPWSESDLGDFALGEGRYGWGLEDVHQFAEPIPWKGAQGLFNIRGLDLSQIDFVAKGKVL